MKIIVTQLSSDVLNRAWYSWLEQERERVGKLTATEQWALQNRVPYGANYFGRRSNKAQRFEQWLFAQGAEVRQHAGKNYLEFVDKSMATMFALRWS